MSCAWAACRVWLTPALEDATEAEVLAELAAGRAQLWAGERGAMVTQLVTGPEPFLHVWLGGGQLTELLRLRPGIEAWARAQGARAVRIHGRRGWRRALKAVGFAPLGDELRKVL
jgi:hypothetical protein